MQSDKCYEKCSNIFFLNGIKTRTICIFSIFFQCISVKTRLAFPEQRHCIQHEQAQLGIIAEVWLSTKGKSRRIASN